MKRPIKTLATGKAPVAPKLLPRLVPLSHGQSIFGPSRATWYRAAKAGQIRMVKVGRATFLDTESVLVFLANLPPAVALEAAA